MRARGINSTSNGILITKIWVCKRFHNSPDRRRKIPVGESSLLFHLRGRLTRHTRGV